MRHWNATLYLSFFPSSVLRRAGVLERAVEPSSQRVLEQIINVAAPWSAANLTGCPIDLTGFR